VGKIGFFSNTPCERCEGGKRWVLGHKDYRTGEMTKEDFKNIVEAGHRHGVRFVPTYVRNSDGTLRQSDELAAYDNE